VADDSVVCYDDMTTTLDELPLESNAIEAVIHYLLPSCRISFPYLHTCSTFTSPRCLCISHSARHFNGQVSSATWRTILGAFVVCYITDDSWRKCRLLDHGYNAVAMTLGPAASTLHWLLTEDDENVEKGQIMWVHTYPTTSSRRRERRVQSSVEIGSEMWTCIKYIQTNKEEQKTFHLYI
jgi:hypothetical protein